MTNVEFSSNWPSPAKLNLFLYITGRRADGYHELQTLFQFLDYGDQLAFRVHANDQVLLQPVLADVPIEVNLIYRAAMLLKQHTGCTKGVDIHLNKRLPMGGGVGGGSSNAATTLVALNQLWALNLTQAELARLGLTLGADVPIFILGHSAIAEGIGERLTPVEVSEPWYLVVRPPVHVATAAIFQHPDLKRDTPKRNHEALLKDRWLNDFEPIVHKTYPEVAMVLEQLLKYAPSRLTGSGCCVFAQVSSREEAMELQHCLPGEIESFIARGCNRSPLLDRLEACLETPSQSG